MSTGILHSDHINYLILRYLQESGHEKAAVAFHQDWHRPTEYRDPENLPFAQVVQRHELVAVVQEGLRHDELLTRVKKEQRRFQWVNVNARDINGRLGDGGNRSHPGMENGIVPTRPSLLSSRRKARLPASRQSDDFPTPAPKRQRRSEGSEPAHVTHVNGDADAMDVDGASPSPDPHEDAGSASPTTAVSDVEIVEEQERYDSMDVASQTDLQPRIKTSTMYFKVEKPDAEIFHCQWKPPDLRDNSGALLVAGDQLCRHYKIPKSFDGLKQIDSVDEPLLNSRFSISAVAWHPKGCTSACALDQMPGLEDDTDHWDTPLIVTQDRDEGTSTRRFMVTNILPSSRPVTVALQYSPTGDFLLLLRTCDNVGSVMVWNTTDHLSGSKFGEPLAWHVWNNQVFDAVWTAYESFAVCGSGGCWRVSIGPDRQLHVQSLAGYMDSRGRGSYGYMVEDYCWDRIVYDDQIKSVAAASPGSQMLSLLPISKPPEGVNRASMVPIMPGLTALAFRPIISSDNGSDDENSDAGSNYETTLLATAYETGEFEIFAINHHPDSLHIASHQRMTFSGPILALKWSPDGAYLAFGRVDIIQIWEVDFSRSGGFGAVMRASNSSPYKFRPLTTWRPDRATLQSTMDVPSDASSEASLDERILTEPSLSWSADGELLALALGKQIMIMRFRPPLHGDKSRVLLGPRM